nr:hypothetical protein [Sphingomonas sp. Ant H11]
MTILCANTDVQAMRAVPAANRLQLGRQITAGLGAGGRPEIGRAAAEEALPEIIEALQGASLCFIAAGLGGWHGNRCRPGHRQSGTRPRHPDYWCGDEAVRL